MSYDEGPYFICDANPRYQLIVNAIIVTDKLNNVIKIIFAVFFLIILTKKKVSFIFISLEIYFFLIVGVDVCKNPYICRFIIIITDITKL